MATGHHGLQWVGLDEAGPSGRYRTPGVGRGRREARRLRLQHPAVGPGRCHRARHQRPV